MARAPHSPASPYSHEPTKEMDVANMTFMIDRLGADCGPLQYIRELTQNAIAAALARPERSGEIIWDVDWNRYTLTKRYKLCIIDTGIGMTGEEMAQYINRLSSSVHQQSTSGNFGVGAKIAAVPRNHAGLIYLSWKDEAGSMIHLWRNPESNVYGLRGIEAPDGLTGYWAAVEDTIKPTQIKDHGTMVVLLGNDVDANTMLPPEGTPMPSRWVLRYLNTRYFRFPEGVTVKAREGWELPAGDSHNFLRTVTGQEFWLEENAEAKGTLRVSNATVRWWILRPDIDQNSGHLAGGGHVAALYQDELYEMTTGRAGVARLQAFGVIFGHNRVILYVEPDNGASSELTTNTARTQLMIAGQPLPWTDWAAEFRENLPPEIVALIEQAGASSEATDHRQAIRDRLKQIKDLFKVSRYRPAPEGNLTVDDEVVTAGGKPRESASERTGTSPSGGRGGRAGDIYSLFLAAKGTPGEEFALNRDPDRKWIEVAAGTRVPPDLEDRAAKYLPQQNLLLINGDFRVFTDMIDRWCERYSHVPAARTVVSQVVREWFEQQLVEAILGSLTIRSSRQWTVDEVERLWSEEALTAVVLPRWHVDVAIRRALGAKLGTLKDRTVA
jgi:hypothetical protein